MLNEEIGGLIVPFCALYRLLNLSTDLHKTWYERYVLQFIFIVRHTQLIVAK